MKLFFSSVLFLAATAIASAALARTSTGSSQSFAINGTSAPEVISWSGGDAVGSVATQPVTGKKQISSVTYSPLVVETRLPLSSALTDCLADLCANRANPRTLSLNTHDASGKVTSTLHASNAILDEVRFPKLDGSSKESVVITFVFRIGNTKDASAETYPSPTKSKQALTANFRLAIDGLPTNRVASIEPLIIKRGAPGKAVEISDLALSISSADEAGWSAWNASFLLKGDNQDSAEKGGTLELLSVDMKTPILSLKLSNVGLIGLASPPVPAETIARLNALLYVESISLPSPSASIRKPALDAAKVQDISPAAKRSLSKP